MAAPRPGVTGGASPAAGVPAASGVPPASPASAACGGGIVRWIRGVPRHGEPGLVVRRGGERDGQPPQRGAQRHVQRLRPVGEPGEDLHAADDHLDRVDDRHRHGEPDDRGTRALGAPRCERRDPHHDEHEPRHVPVQQVRLVQRADEWIGVGPDRDHCAVHERPVREHQPRVDGRDVGSEQQEHEHRCGGEDRQQREPLGAAMRGKPRGVEGADGDEHEQPEQRHRRREVRRDRLARVVLGDGLPPEPRLEHHQHHRGEARPEEGRAIAVVLPREERDTQDQEADDGGDRAVDPLPPRLGVVERREQLAIAHRPVRAAHAGPGGAHDDAHRDEQERRDDGGESGLLEAGHGLGDRPWGARGQRRLEPGGTQAAILPARRGDRPSGHRRVRDAQATLSTCVEPAPPSSRCSRS